MRNIAALLTAVPTSAARSSGSGTDGSTVSDTEPATEVASYRNGDVTEPWVFLIGAYGKIADRWQNVLHRPQLSAGLAALLAKEASP